jgi:Protein required for attachment to host cells
MEIAGLCARLRCGHHRHSFPKEISGVTNCAMNNKLVVITDLGSFKAYKLHADGLHSTPRLELIEQFNLDEAHRKFTDGLSDLAGRYHSPSLGKWATPWGERHNIELERKRRLIKQVAHALADLLRRDGSDGCYLAAGKEINHQILAELPRSLHPRIEKIVPCDLTKADKSEILKHFDIPKLKLSDMPFLPGREQMRRNGGSRLQA